MHSANQKQNFYFQSRRWLFIFHPKRIRIEINSPPAADGKPVINFRRASLYSFCSIQTSEFPSLPHLFYAWMNDRQTKTCQTLLNEIAAAGSTQIFLLFAESIFVHVFKCVSTQQKMQLYIILFFCIP
jgi:hypothetical protein